VKLKSYPYEESYPERPSLLNSPLVLLVLINTSHLGRESTYKIIITKVRKEGKNKLLLERFFVDFFSLLKL